MFCKKNAKQWSFKNHFVSYLSGNCTAWGTTSTWICLPPSSCELCQSWSKMLCWRPTTHYKTSAETRFRPSPAHPPQWSCWTATWLVLNWQGRMTASLTPLTKTIHKPFMCSCLSSFIFLLGSVIQKIVVYVNLTSDCTLSYSNPKGFLRFNY